MRTAVPCSSRITRALTRPSQAALVAHNPVFNLVRVAGGQGGDRGVPHGVAIIGIDEGEQRVRGEHRQSGKDAEDPARFV